MLLRSVVRSLVVVMLVGGLRPAAAGADATPDRETRVLVFSKTAGFRHASIPDGVEAITTLGASHGFGVDATEDAAVFDDERLAAYAAVVFLSTTGDVLDERQQAAFERYIQSGGGYAGVHAASDTEYEWPWYGRLVGAYFKGHPRVQTARVLVADRIHPSTAALPARWSRRDEWYDYRDNPRGRVHVLAMVDEHSYEGGTMGDDHPIAWCHDFDGGRAWYTGGGHTAESFAEPLFIEHLLGGLRWAAGLTDDGGTGPEPGFEAIFDGRTLDGWRRVGGQATYRVEQGCIVGEVGPGPNTFLRTERVFGDFELRLDVRLDEPSNSGIQFRSHQQDGDGRVYGYQCEIDPSERAWSGGLYDEGRRGWLFSLDGRDDARRAFRRAGWNAYVIEAKGPRLRTWVNGVLCADLHDERDTEGFIALQVHSGERGRIRWRNVRLRVLGD